jgi:ubiquinone/menaquinone biosynthesis C-methylase UbiE
MNGQAFTPALGRFLPARFFDYAAALTRERLWRTLTVSYLAPRPGDVIVDVGCGTGSLALLLSHVEPRAQIIGLDPDPDVLAVAQRKAADTRVQWRVGMGDELMGSMGAESVTGVVSSLVLHQCPVTMKRAVLEAMFAVLRPGGRLVITDYGRQRTRLMRTAFRVVQLADGRADTQPNSEGVVPELMSSAGFCDVRETEVIATVTGSISIYVAHKE